MNKLTARKIEYNCIYDEHKNIIAYFYFDERNCKIYKFKSIAGQPAPKIVFTEAGEMIYEENHGMFFYHNYVYFGYIDDNWRKAN